MSRAQRRLDGIQLMLSLLHKHHLIPSVQNALMSGWQAFCPHANSWSIPDTLASGRLVSGCCVEYRQVKWKWISITSHLWCAQVRHVLTRDHTVVPATNTCIHKFTVPHLPLLPALRLVLISRPTEDRRLSWPGWLVEVLRWYVIHPSTSWCWWLRPVHYHWAMPRPSSPAFVHCTLCCWLCRHFGAGLVPWSVE